MQEAYRPLSSKCLLCWGVPHPWSGGYHILGPGGTPSRPGQGGTLGTPLRPEMGYPPYLRWGTLPARPGMGYPPLARPRMGFPPSAMVNRETFPSINITFPRTTYAGGKNETCKKVQWNCFLGIFNGMPDNSFGDMRDIFVLRWYSLD